MTRTPREAFEPALLARCDLLQRVRPMALAERLARLLLPADRRRIVTTLDGVDLYVDPLTHLGHEVVSTGTYEPDTARLLRGHLRPGRSYLDVGANEGVFVALASRLIGPGDVAVAVEPQRRLLDLVRLNAGLNGCPALDLVHGALGGANGDVARLRLWPVLNTGASSLARGYRFGRRSEEVRFVEPRTLFERHPGRRWVVKVDVEGYEDRVVARLLPALRSGAVAVLLVDYHLSVNPGGARPTHEAIIAAGLRSVARGPEHGYVTYTWPEAG